MKDGQEYTLGLKLNTTGIKEDMENIKKDSGFTGNDPGTVTGDVSLDVVGIMNAESQMTADVKIPEGIDMSKVDLSNLQLGDNFGEYKDNESLKHVAIANTDPKVYDLSGYKFKVTSAAYDETSRNLHIVMTLQIPKNYNGKSYDEISQFNFGCLYSIVNGMPDNFTLEIPGIKLAKNAKANTNMTFDGSMGQNQPKDTKKAVDSDCYMSSKVSYSGSFPVRVNWYASQLAGGEDAANPKESAQGISLTVQKEVPKPVQPVQKTAASKVNTGDTTPIALYVILAAAAVGAAAVLIKHRPARH
ncbi:MAG: sortase B protein-sorting domain-containing protein [Pseudoramibacter sp.]